MKVRSVDVAEKGVYLYVVAVGRLPSSKPKTSFHFDREVERECERSIAKEDDVGFLQGEGEGDQMVWGVCGFFGLELL